MGGRGKGSGISTQGSVATGDSLKNWFNSPSQSVVFVRRNREIKVLKKDGKFQVSDSAGRKIDNADRSFVVKLLAGTVREGGRVRIL